MPRKSKRYYRFFMLAILTICISGGFYLYGHSVNTETVSPLVDNRVQAGETLVPATSVEPTPTPLASIAPVQALVEQKNLPLDEQVAEATKGLTGTFGIAVKNLNTGETYFKNVDEPFFMASTYKIPLVITALSDIEKGALSKDSKVGSFPINKAIDLIITRSEEELARSLSLKLGWGRVTTTARSLGMVKTSFGPDFTTTPRDQLTLLEHIHTGQGMSQTVRDQIYDLMVRQEINDRIPKYLPDGVTTAHKTGELAGNRHDVGIVTAGNIKYIIVLMAKDLGYPERGKEAEAKLSYVFYQYFTK